jgi:hypothetical protein
MKWTALSGRALGQKYADDPRGCQDFAVASYHESRVVLVVCDGAGSARYSHHASAGIATAISDFFLEAEDDIFALEEREFKRRILSVIARKTQALVERHDADINDLLTTMLFVCYAPQLRCGWLGHVGDGMIIGATGDDLEILSHSAVGEVSNLTYFTNHIFVDQSHLRIKSLDGRKLSCVACFSDGVEDVVYLKRRKFQECFFAAGLEPLHPDLHNVLRKVGSISNPDLDGLLKSLWIESDRTDDDCSIALAVDPSEIEKLNLERVIETYKQAIQPVGPTPPVVIGTGPPPGTDASDETEATPTGSDYITPIPVNVAYVTFPRALYVFLKVLALLFMITLLTSTCSSSDDYITTIYTTIKGNSHVP